MLGSINVNVPASEEDQKRIKEAYRRDQMRLAARARRGKKKKKKAAK